MKHIHIILLAFALAAFTGCEKEGAPQASFVTESTDALVGQEITFTITGTAEYWSFWPGTGEISGTNIEEMEFTHTYFTPGTYTAILYGSNVLDDYSILRDSALIQITVTDNEEHAHTRFSAYKLEFRYNFAGFEDKRIKFKMDGTINGTEVTFEVPNSSILDEMRATFSVPATSQVYVGTELQESAWTQNDFNNPVEYRIISVDGTEEISMVTLTRLPKSPNSALMSFGLSSLPSGIGYVTTQEGSKVDVLLSDSCGLDAVTPVFTIHDFARAYIDGVEQESESTAGDYSSEVTFNVTAEDGTATDYQINTFFTPNLLRFYFGEGNDFVAEGVFNGGMDTLFIDTPAGSDLSSLVPSFDIRPSDCTLSLGGVEQESGVSVTNFSSPLACVVSGDVDIDFIVVAR